MSYLADNPAIKSLQ